jgi:AraC family transcriptional regulator
MSAFRFLLNPHFRDLPNCCAVLHGLADSYRVDSYRTTLSLKSVSQGAAYYETRRGRHLVTEDSFLILNHGQEYSLEFQGTGRTETFCPFFQPGFLEHVASSLSATVARQLDEIDLHSPPVHFPERLYPKTGRVALALTQLRSGLRTGGLNHLCLEDWFFTFAEALTEFQGDVQREIDQFPGRRAATRAELYRRLHRGRDFLISCRDQPLTVAQAARVANLSPFHFHRMFRSAFGQTPMQFLQEQRLLSARRLLVQTDEPVTTICFSVGFESLGSFSWLFRRRFGLSPSQFRVSSRGLRKEQD